MIISPLELNSNKVFTEKKQLCKFYFGLFVWFSYNNLFFITVWNKLFLKLAVNKSIIDTHITLKRILLYHT